MRSEKFWEVSLDNKIERTRYFAGFIKPLRSGRVDLLVNRMNWQMIRNITPPSPNKWKSIISQLRDHYSGQYFSPDAKRRMNIQFVSFTFLLRVWIIIAWHTLERYLIVTFAYLNRI